MSLKLAHHAKKLIKPIKKTGSFVLSTSKRGAKGAGRLIATGGRKTIHHTKRAYHSTVKAGKDTIAYTKLSKEDKKLYNIQRGTKTTFKVFAKPHNKLRSKYKWYHSWHSHPHHKKVHHGVLATFSTAIVILLISTIAIPLHTFASTQSWTFANAGDYTLGNNNSLEVANNSGRLKPNSYAPDANTEALYHLNEANGTSIADSSGNNNTGTAYNIEDGDWGAGKLNNGLSLDGTNEYFSAPDSASLSLTGQNTIEGWTKFNSNFGNNTHSGRQYIADKGNYSLYYDNTTGKINYEMEPNTGKSWEKIGGDYVNGTWPSLAHDSKSSVNGMVKIGTNVYAAIGGSAAGEAELWKWDGTRWYLFGGHGVNQSWTDLQYENTQSIIANGNMLYAGLGTGVGDGEVWSCDVTANPPVWSKIGGDGLNNSWQSVSGYRVYSMVIYKGNLIAGTFNSPYIYSWDGITWTKIACDGVNNSWNGGTYNAVFSLATDGDNLYAGIGSNTAGNGEIWKFDGTTWGGAMIGGDGLGDGIWPATNTYEGAFSLVSDGTSLYAGMGASTGEADLYKYDGATWSKIGGTLGDNAWDSASDAHERVWSLAYSAADSALYAGVGENMGDAELWRYMNSVWTKIGGDGANNSFLNSTSNQDHAVYSLLVDGNSIYAGVGSGIFGNHSNLPMVWKTDNPAAANPVWSMIGGDYVNYSWGIYSLEAVQCMASYNGKLYAGTGYAGASRNGMVWEYDGNQWVIVGGQDINNSWTKFTKEEVLSMTVFKGELYVGLGNSANDGEVWKWNGSTWTKVADSDLGIDGWSGYESVRTMVALGDNLYVGTGDGGGLDSDVWSYDGSVWTQIAGRNSAGSDVNSSWGSANNKEYVASLGTFNGKLYAGLGSTAGDGELWEWTSANDWTLIGGDNIGWADSTYENVYAIANYNGKLLAGLGNSTGDAEIWQYDGQSWDLIGGDDISKSWSDLDYEIVKSMAVYNGYLYASLGNGSGDARVFRYEGNKTWTKVGGDFLSGSWGGIVQESAWALTVHNGRLYVGLGDGGLPSDARIYCYGSNVVLSSAQTTQDNNWHHVAATYDGGTMRIYIDGVLNASQAVGVSMSDNSLPLLVGTGYGSPGAGMGAGGFTGSLDEIRISNTARTSFNTSTYTSSAQTITLASAFKTSGVKSWDGFSATTSGGGTVTFRLSHDGGTTWKYYDTGEWKTSASTSQTNTVADVNTNISTFPVTNSGILWQAVLVGNGEEQVALTNVTVEYTPDDSAPSNPTSITGYAEEGSATELTSGQWYDFAAPYFEWSGAMDEGGSGVGGYFVYFGTSAAGVPSEFQTDAHYHATGLVSGSTYYLRIKSRDNAFNPAATVLDAFTYKYNSGGTAPTKPLNLVHQKCVTINEAPNCSGGASTALSPSSINRFSFSWDEPEVVVNGIKKYHYSVNVEPSETNTNSTTNKYLTADAFATQQGKNTLYVVAEDSQGGISWSNYESVDFYASTSAPGAPENVAITDSSNRTAGQYRLTITWTPASSGVTPADYEIYRSTNGNDFASIGTTTSTGYLDSGLSTGTTYYYKVKALDSAGAESAFSGLVAKDPTGKFATPPTITSTPVATSGANYVKVVWDTDRVSEGIAECGKTLEYGISGIDLEPKTHHEVTISGLNPDTKYNFRVQSLDPGEFRDYSSTEGRSANYIITTQPAPGMSDVSFSDITTSSAILNFKTTKASTSTIDYGTSLDYGMSVTDISGGAVTQHSIRFVNLTDGTTYQVKISIDDGDGNALSSIGHSFTTIAKPRISSLKLQPIDDAPTTTYDVYWTTNVPTSSNAVFTATGRTNKTNSKADLELDHVLRVTDLEDQATYSITVSGRDKYGNYVEQLAPNVTTPIDTREPKLSNLAVEVRASGVGSTQKAQVVVSWQTDELSTSMIEYDQGMSGDSYSRKSQQDTVYTNNHVVIISELEPSKIYHLRAVSTDKAGNIGNSSDTTVITGKTQKSILDLILNSLVNSFSWLGKVFE